MKALKRLLKAIRASQPFNAVATSTARAVLSLVGARPEWIIRHLHRMGRTSVALPNGRVLRVSSRAHGWVSSSRGCARRVRGDRGVVGIHLVRIVPRRPLGPGPLRYRYYALASGGPMPSARIDADSTLLNHLFLPEDKAEALCLRGSDVSWTPP